MAHAAAVRSMPDAYRLPVFGIPDPLFRRCLQISGALGVILIALVYLAPKRATEITVEEMPERFAKLILEEPKAPAAPPIALPKPPEIAKAEVKPEVKPQPMKDIGQRRQKKPPVPVDRGKVGRERAQQQVATLNEVTSSLDKVLADVSTSLASNDDGKKTERTQRRRRTRSGRNAAQVASVGGAVPTIDADAASSSISGSQIAIESIGEISGNGYVPGGASTGGMGARGGEARSDASLLAVVRKYAPGIQFCYDNELKKSPGLGGKLVVSLTVAANGRVTESIVVRDTVGSAALTSCALAQIEAWKFPTIPEGVVTFQAPFIFTPPE